MAEVSEEASVMPNLSVEARSPSMKTAAVPSLGRGSPGGSSRKLSSPKGAGDSSHLFDEGARVRHKTRGLGTVIELMADGRTRVLFDDGDEHRYKPSSMHKIWIDNDAKALSQEEMAILLVQRKTRTALGTKRFVHSASYRKTEVRKIEGGDYDPEEVTAAIKMQGAVRGWQVRTGLGAAGLSFLEKIKVASPAPGKQPTLTGFISPLKTKGRRRSINGQRLSKAEVSLLSAAEKGETAVALSAHYDSGASLGVQDEEGRTPVMCAADANQTITALLLLKCGGARTDLKDRQGRSSLSYAITRQNVALTLALISNVCGLAGDTSAELSIFLSERELTRLYRLLSELDIVRFGRAIALLFLTDPEGCLLVLVRAITAVRDRAASIEKREHEQALQLKRMEDLIRAGISALFHHGRELVIPAQLVKTVGALYALKEDLAAAQALCRESCERREVVGCMLRASQSALTVAVNNECKELLHQTDMRLFFEELWGGQLLANLTGASAKVTSVATLTTYSRAASKATLARAPSWVDKAKASTVATARLTESSGVRGMAKGVSFDLPSPAIAPAASTEASASGNSPQKSSRVGGTDYQKHRQLAVPASKPALMRAATSRMPRWLTPEWAEHQEARPDHARLSKRDSSGSEQDEAPEPCERHPFADFWIGASVTHPKHGPGRVENFIQGDSSDVNGVSGDAGRVEMRMEYGSMRVEFDNGDTCAAACTHTCARSHLARTGDPPPCALRLAAGTATTPRA